MKLLLTCECISNLNSFIIFSFCIPNIHASKCFVDYYRVVNEALTTYNEECVTAVKQGTKQLEILLQDPNGQRSIDRMFKLCDPIENLINNSKDISNFFENLAGNFAGIVQYNKDNRISKNVKVSKITIDTLCDIMVATSIGAQAKRLAAVSNMLLDAYSQKCLDYKYSKMIETYGNTSWDSETAEGGK